MRVVVEPHDYELLVRGSCAVGLVEQVAAARSMHWRAAVQQDARMELACRHSNGGVPPSFTHYSPPPTSAGALQVGVCGHV